MSASTIGNPGCQTFVVALSAGAFPILGTMQGYSVESFNPNSINPCTQALVPTTQASRTGQVFPPSGLRYYYKVSNTGNVVPNSMYQANTVQPGYADNGDCILEFICTSCSNASTTY